MKCPYCAKHVVLTWKRYWSSPLGRHKCPECGELFRLKHSLIYYAVIFSVAVLLGLTFPMFRRFMGLDFLQASIAYIILCIVILIPIDRWVDSRWRGTVQVKSKA